VEPNEYMDAYAKEKAAALGLQLKVVRGRGEALPLDDASVDAVVATLVLCTVENPAAVLAEVARVLRPGGRFVFVEHVAASNDGLLLAQQVQCTLCVVPYAWWCTRVGELL
jgi:ubiquinone/menaquinone biosynthesis C-methylase UbiE